MTQDEIIEMAKPAEWLGNVEGWTFNTYQQLEAFAKLVAAKERDRMCKQCTWSNYENAACNEANQSKVLGEG